MNIRTADYIGSYPKESSCPQALNPEYAFVGRSNVGKSSLINALTGRKKLAKVSSTPGKTQMINFFKINNMWHLVDLPGYGYAKISKTKRRQWERMIEDYMRFRKMLQTAFVLIDASIPPQKIDLDFINTLGEYRVPFAVVFTKSDKAKSTQRKKNIEAFRLAMLENWESLPEMFFTSSKRKQGVSELLDYIHQLNESFYEQMNP